jgi:membrane protease YdiL (CAAX protease family)
VFILVQSITASIYAMVHAHLNPKADISQFLHGLGYNGNFLSYSLIATSVVCSLLVWFVTALRRDYPVADYLKLHRVGIGRVVLWLLVLLALVIAVDLLSYLLGRERVPVFMQESYASANHLWLYFIAIVVAAPVFEELFFRGFLLEGLRFTRLGNIGAAVLVSASWALVHGQYGMFDIGMIFMIGLVLAFARLRTNSLFTSITLHMVNNLLAFVQIAGYYPHG